MSSGSGAAAVPKGSGEPLKVVRFAGPTAEHVVKKNRLFYRRKGNGWSDPEVHTPAARLALFWRPDKTRAHDDRVAALTAADSAAARDDQLARQLWNRARTRAAFAASQDANRVHAALTQSSRDAIREARARDTVVDPPHRPGSAAASVAAAAMHAHATGGAAAHSLAATGNLFLHAVAPPLPDAQQLQQHLQQQQRQQSQQHQSFTDDDFRVNGGAHSRRANAAHRRAAAGLPLTFDFAFTHPELVPPQRRRLWFSAAKHADAASAIAAKGYAEYLTRLSDGQRHATYRAHLRALMRDRQRSNFEAEARLGTPHIRQRVKAGRSADAAVAAAASAAAAPAVPDDDGDDDHDFGGNEDPHGDDADLDGYGPPLHAAAVDDGANVSAHDWGAAAAAAVDDTELDAETAAAASGLSRRPVPALVIASGGAAAAAGFATPHPHPHPPPRAPSQPYAVPYVSPRRARSAAATRSAASASARSSSATGAIGSVPQRPATARNCRPTGSGATAGAATARSAAATPLPGPSTPAPALVSPRLRQLSQPKGRVSAAAQLHVDHRDFAGLWLPERARAEHAHATAAVAALAAHHRIGGTHDVDAKGMHPDGGDDDGEYDAHEHLERQMQRHLHDHGSTGHRRRASQPPTAAPDHRRSHSRTHSHGHAHGHDRVPRPEEAAAHDTIAALDAFDAQQQHQQQAVAATAPHTTDPRPVARPLSGRLKLVQREEGAYGFRPWLS